jgi:hypothetical protein
LALAHDAVIRATFARSLRLAGFEAASLAMSSPSGPFPSSRRTTGEAEQVRQGIVRQKHARAALELRARTIRSPFRSGGERYRGRQIRLDLPAPIRSDGRDVRSVRIRQGVNVRFLSELARRPLIEGPLQDADIPWRQVVGPIKTQSDHFTARLRIGSLFTSEIDLNK